ncbi:antA/AntB antirepressor family protein [Tellurirhabdus bombi]|uniref:antA/AntB antirepressor family protein n=1 Tax=Tellurirhabdus bombi TaxID=2907205 RepID=UPI001F31A3AC|nr:antA/AntB antirepressor family protein [Tellurirhabdus bombi]
MKDLIQISTNEHGAQTVSARELHTFLQVKSEFAKWCKRMFGYGFSEGVDYVEVFVKNGENQLGGRPSIDYALTLDCAKEISMLQRNERGKQARLYFIECEKRLRQVATSQSKKATKYQRLGKGEKWIEGRMQGVATRNSFTRALGAHGVTKEGFRNCTNAIYTPLYGGTTSVVRLKKGLPDKANIRDNMTELELAAINLAELLASQAIQSEGLRGNGECELACNRASRSVATAIIQNQKNKPSQTA